MELDRLFQKKLKVFENGVFHGQLAGALQTVFRRMLLIPVKSADRNVILISDCSAQL